MCCCQDIEKLLSDYIDGELDDKTRSEMDEHLADCPPCLEFLESFRNVVRATHQVRQLEMPPELKERLRQFLSEKLSRGC